MNRFLTTTLLALSLLGISQALSNASILNDMLRSYVGGPQYGFGVRTTAEDRMVPNEAFVERNFTTRLGQISDQINRARADGRLSFNESARLLAQLDQFSAEVDARASGGFSYGEVSDLISRIESFARSVDSEIASASTGGTGGGTQVGVGFHQRLLNLSRRIDREASRRMLTWEQRRNLRNSISWISRMEQELMGDDGMISFEDQQLLNAALSRVSTRLNSYVAANRRFYY